MSSTSYHPHPLFDQHARHQDVSFLDLPTITYVVGFLGGGLASLVLYLQDMWKESGIKVSQELSWTGELPSTDTLVGLLGDEQNEVLLVDGVFGLRTVLDNSTEIAKLRGEMRQRGTRVVIVVINHERCVKTLLRDVIKEEDDLIMPVRIVPHNENCEWCFGEREIEQTRNLLSVCFCTQYYNENT